MIWGLGRVDALKFQQTNQVAVNMIIYAVKDLAEDSINGDCDDYTKSTFREICYCTGISMNEIGDITIRAHENLGKNLGIHFIKKK